MRRIANLSNAPSGATRRFAVFATALLLAFTSMGIGAASPAPTLASAPDVGTWHHNPGTGHWYALVNNLDYAGAEAYAVTVGGHLVTINDQAEQDWLSSDFPGTGYRIGFNDKAVEGTWVWTSGETPTYTNWRAGEPNNHDAIEFGGEDVAEVEPIGGIAAWNDVPDNGPATALVELGPGLAPYVVVPDQAATIAEALTLVGTGGTIHVRAGTYAGGFVIDKRVTLEGEDWDHTVIDGGGSPVAIMVQASGATLASFKVVAAAPNVGIRFISASDNTLDHVWTDGGQFGIRFYNGSNRNQVVDSRASNAVEWGVDGGDRSGGSGSANNTYRRIEAWGNGGGVVAYAGSDGTAVINCNLHDNHGAALQIGWLSAWSVTGTVMTRSGSGLVLDSTSSGFVTDNTISNNAQAGVRIAGGGTSSGNTFSGNQIADNGSNGIDLASNAVGNLFHDNTISGNAVGARVARNENQPSHGNRFIHNTFTDNTVNARADEERQGGNTWDDGYPSGGNTWDDAPRVDAFSGPGQDAAGADGIVDTPYAITGAADVDRYPLLFHAPGTPFRFTVDPGNGPGFGFIDGQGFTPGQEITVSLNGVQIGMPIADPYGNFWLDFPDDQDPPITMQPGDTVTVTAGGLTKTTVVTHLRITGVVGNVVSGIADTATVQLWVAGSQVNRQVPVVAGHWSADVGEPGANLGEEATTTLGPGSYISTEELDEDGDGTQADFGIPNPVISVYPDQEQIFATGFTVGAAVQVSVNGTALDTGSGTFDENSNFWFDSPVDIRAGDTVVVSDGSATKTHVVTDITVRPISGNVVSGTAGSGQVHVTVWGTDVWRDVLVVGGAWSADVGEPGVLPEEQATIALEPGMGVSAQQFDVDDDATEVQTHVFDPRFTVGVNGPWVQGFDFEPHGTATITRNGDQIVTDDPITTDRDGQFWLDSPVGFAAGDTVVVTDGHVTKTLVIAPLVVDAIVGNVISGHTAPGAAVSVGVYDTEVGRDFLADATGAWAVDVSVPGDDDWEQQTVELGPGSRGSVEAPDGDGDATQLEWWIADPTFNVNANDEYVWGDQFGQPVVVTIHPVTGEDRTWSGEAIGYEEDGFGLGLQDTGEPWDLQPGQTVTVEGPNGTKTLVVADLALTGYDLDANTVTGATDRAGTVTVDIEKGDEQAPHAEARLGSGGDWVVDFDDADPPYQLQLFDGAWISQSDEDGDGTTIGMKTLAPTRFLFSPVIQDVVGSEWPEGADVTLTIHRDGVSPDFRATTSVGIDCNDRDTCPNQYLPLTGSANVFFNLGIGPFHARAGDVMTMSNGTITKELIVPDITVGLGEDDVLWTDDDADRVWVPAPHPDLGMDPQADRVWISDLPAAGDVTVTITRSGATVHTQTVHTANVLTRGEWLLDMWTQPTGNVPRPVVGLFDLGSFDLQGGDIVGVTDGTHEPWLQTVANLTVDSVNAATDTVTGTAAPNPAGPPPDEECSVRLHLGEGEGGWWGYCATPDENGHWSFFFDESHFPWQGLEPGMVGQAMIGHNTIVFWTVPAGHVAGDYDGNGTTDLAVFRPGSGSTQGYWYIAGQTNVQWGTSTDIPVPGDYDGNGTTDLTVFRPSDGVWYVRGVTNAEWGTSGDIPVPGDYDGNGTTDLAVFRPSDGVWYVRGVTNAEWGTAGDIPVPGDYDGDGTTDMAVFRPGSGSTQGYWYIAGQTNVQWGVSTDIPVPGDYDGNGTTDLAVFRPSTGVWYVRGVTNAEWGTSGDIPVPGDYDGDGTTDMAVFRPGSGSNQGYWYLRGVTNVQWGISTDIPLSLPYAICHVSFP